MNPYDVLAIEKHATPSQIRSQYRKKLLQCHPDRVQGDDLKRQRADEFFRVQQAYEVLSSETRRQEYGEETAAKFPANRAMADSCRVSITKARTAGACHLVVRRQPAKAQTADSRPVRRPPRLKRGNATNKDASHRISDVSESRPAIPGQKSSETALKVVHNWGDGNAQLQEISTDAVATDRVNGESKSSCTFCGLKGKINGTRVFALADTGSHRNFINGAYAESLGLKSTHYALDQRPSFVMGHGRTIQAIGEIGISWQFERDSYSSYNIVLQVLPNSIFDVMIGAEFLYETNTMAGNNHRLCRIPKPDRAMLARNISFCGSPRRYLNGVLHAAESEPKRCFALPDSGAEANILSYEFAKRMGWLTDLVPRLESDRLLLFADGSTARSEGQLHLEWTFCYGWRIAFLNAEHYLTFDVLSGCPVDAILGEDFLDETDAFTNHAEAFIDDFKKRTSGITPVVWANNTSLFGPLKGKLKRKGKAEELRMQTSQGDGEKVKDLTNLLHSELQRRAEADHKIFNARKDPVRKVAEETSEEAKRKKWDIDRSSKQQADQMGSQKTFSPSKASHQNLAKSVLCSPMLGNSSRHSEALLSKPRSRSFPSSEVENVVQDA